MPNNNLPFEKHELVVSVNNPNNLPVIDFHLLKDLQGDLKITTPTKIEKLKNSIRKYGIFVPKFTWIDNGTYYIEDGHQTIKALTELEKEGYTVPPIPYVVIEAKDRKDAGEKLLMINSRFADINPETTFFTDFDIGLDFVDEIEIPELEFSLDGMEEEVVEDEVPEAPEEPVTQVGDLWLCGQHRVLCGDATKAEDVQRLMDGKKADMVFTDPPYGVSYADKNAFLNAIDKGNHIQDKIEGDHQTVAEMKELWVSSFKLAFQYSRIGASYYICSPQGGELMMMMMMAILEAGWNLKQSIIWVKNNHVLGRSDYHYKHEPLLYGWKESPHSFYGGTSETTVWEIDKPHKSELHSTQKPLALPARAIRNSSKENDIIADFFLGSGTTLIAAEQHNRICYGMEIEPKYVDVICQRFFNLTGIDPIRESDSKKWSELQQ
jgi:DNA modification methylase